MAASLENHELFLFCLVSVGRLDVGFITEKGEAHWKLPGVQGGHLPRAAGLAREFPHS